MMSAACASRPANEHPSPVLAEAHNKLFIDPSNYVIVIDRDPTTKTDRIQVNGMVIDISNVYDKIHSDFNYSQIDAVIEAAPDVHYGTVLTVMAAAHDAGFNNFGLATRTYDSGSTTGKLTGFQKDLDPNPKSSPSPSRRGANIEVLVNSKNVVYLDGNRTSHDNLYTGFAHYVSLHRNRSRSGDAPHVALTADTDASWQTIVLILDASRQAGDDNIGFVTE